MLPAYRIDGPEDAPVLVLANSLGTTSALWEYQMPVLTGHFRVVRYEHRGHGGTPAPPGPYRIGQLGADVLELLDAVGAAQASVCGISLGGMVAMWLAAHAPERIDRLVLACTAPYLPPARPWVERAATVRASGPAVLLDGLMGRWFTAALADRSGVTRMVAGMLAQADAEGYAGCCEAIAAMDQRDDLGAIRAPTLVLAGAEDPVTPPATALATQAQIPGAALVVLAGAAHLANIEQPDRFGAAVVEHLAGAPAQRGRRVRAEVLGAAHVERSEASAGAFTAPFTDLITRYAWGEIWTRPGLDRATRSCITLAMLVALGRFDELALHVAGARRNGLTSEQIGEVLLQTTVYCGAPAANRAFAVARQVLDAHDAGE